jgi:hypothetical protein
MHTPLETQALRLYENGYTLINDYYLISIKIINAIISTKVQDNIKPQ